MASIPFPFHQRRADKQLTRHHRINRAVIDFAIGNNRNAIQRDFFARHNGVLGFLPMRLAITAFHQMLGKRLNPIRLNTRGNASPQTGGFHQLGHHGPFRLFLEQTRTWEDSETGISRALKFVLLHIFNPDMGQHA